MYFYHYQTHREYRGISLIQYDNLISNMRNNTHIMSNVGLASRRLAKRKGLPFGRPFLFVNQQLPILPGRLQPSTFGVYELNYCVRDGNRWILIAIATESVRVYTLKTT